MTVRYLVGDVRKVIPTLADSSVDLVLTSPPYLNLRSYLPSDHPDKASEMGSEATPGAFIDALLDVVEVITPKLAPHASMCIELGDSMAGSGGAGGDYNEGGLRDGQPKFRQVGSREHRPEREGTGADGGARVVSLNAGPGWPLDRSLCLIPEIFRFSLVYGVNPLTGRETPRWRARNVVRHFRPNPPVGALGGKYRPATSEWLVVMKGERRYFDLDSVRTEPKSGHAGEVMGLGPGKVNGAWRGVTDGGGRDQILASHPAGAPPLDWWDDDDLEWRDAAGMVLPTQPYSGAHYAVFSERVVARLLEPMCPRRVCRVCGKPSERITDVTHQPNRTTNGPQSIDRRHLNGGSAGFDVRADRIASTLGWTECGCGDNCEATTWRIDACPTLDDDGNPVLDKKGRPKMVKTRVVDNVGRCADPSHWRPGLVLDPFGGSGTTGSVANGHGRDAILIDLNPENLELARQRLGMFLDTDEIRTVVNVTVGEAL